MFERQGHIANCDFNRLSFELCTRLLLVDKLLLFPRQMFGKQNLGVDLREKGRKFDRGGLEEDRKTACKFINTDSSELYMVDAHLLTAHSYERRHGASHWRIGTRYWNCAVPIGSSAVLSA